MSISPCECRMCTSDDPSPTKESARLVQWTSRNQPETRPELQQPQQSQVRRQPEHGQQSQQGQQHPQSHGALGQQPTSKPLFLLPAAPIYNRAGAHDPPGSTEPYFDFGNRRWGFPARPWPTSFPQPGHPSWNSGSGFPGQANVTPHFPPRLQSSDFRSTATASAIFEGRIPPPQTNVIPPPSRARPLFPPQPPSQPPTVVPSQTLLSPLRRQPLAPAPVTYPSRKLPPLGLFSTAIKKDPFSPMHRKRPAGDRLAPQVFDKDEVQRGDKRKRRIEQDNIDEVIADVHTAQAEIARSRAKRLHTAPDRSVEASRSDKLPRARPTRARGGGRARARGRGRATQNLASRTEPRLRRLAPKPVARAMETGSGSTGGRGRGRGMAIGSDRTSSEDSQWASNEGSQRASIDWGSSEDSQRASSDGTQWASAESSQWASSEGTQRESEES